MSNRPHLPGYTASSLFARHCQAHLAIRSLSDKKTGCFFMGMNYMPKWHLIGHFAVVGMGERNLGGRTGLLT
ncbi:MAG: hypothetical protein ABIN18_01290 [Pseudomonadota bacterium]